MKTYIIHYQNEEGKNTWTTFTENKNTGIPPTLQDITEEFFKENPLVNECKIFEYVGTLKAIRSVKAEFCDGRAQTKP